MRLAITDVKRITRGAVRVEEYEDGIHFYRFSSAQEKYYFDSGNVDFYNKSFATAGIELAFKTDAVALIFKGNATPASSRGYFAVDFYVNGCLVEGIKNFKTVDHTNLSVSRGWGDVQHSISLNGNSEIRIVFPWSAIFVLKELELVDATYINPVKRSKRIIMFGDSITQGYDTAYPSNSYAVRFGELMDAEIINKGIGGERFAPELALRKDNFLPDFITVAYGTNDWSHRNRKLFTEKCRGFYKNLSDNYPNTKIFAISPIWRASYKTDTAFGSFVDIIKVIREVTADLDNVTIIDGLNFVPHDSVYMADLTLHPNDDGFAHYASNLTEAISNLL